MENRAFSPPQKRGYINAMKFVTFTLLLLFIFAQAFAQDHVIRVIGDDGNETVVEIPSPNAPARAPEKPASPSEPVVKKVPSRSILDPVPTQTQPAAAPALTPPAITKTAPDIPVRSAPIPKPKTVKAAAIKKPVAPRPSAKPLPPMPDPALDPEKAAYYAPPKAVDGKEVSQKLAKRIALEIAPPSRNIQVFPRTFEDRPVHVVRFKTDDGFFDVLVDRENGEILATKDL